MRNVPVTTLAAASSAMAGVTVAGIEMNTSYSPTRITGRRFMLPDAVVVPERGSRRFRSGVEEVGEASRTSIGSQYSPLTSGSGMGALTETVGMSQRDFGALCDRLTFVKLPGTSLRPS